MNKMIIFSGILLVTMLASGCQSLIALNPPKAKTEILCEEWTADVDNSSKVRAKGE